METDIDAQAAATPLTRFSWDDERKRRMQVRAQRALAKAEPDEQPAARNARAIAELDKTVPPRRSRYGLHEVPQPEPEPQPDWSNIWQHFGFARDEGDMSWTKKGACRIGRIETDVFYPGRGDHRAVAAAKQVCASCPVTAECLAYALEHGEPGVWGGTTHSERRSRRKSA